MRNSQKNIIMKKSIVYTFALVSFVLFTANFTTVSLEKPDGKALYIAANCSACHGKKGKSILNIAPSLQNPELTLERRIEVITNGSKKESTMIAFSPKYTTEEIKAIAEYTMSFVKK